MELTFTDRFTDLCWKQEVLFSRKNIYADRYNGIVNRFMYPVITRDHIPLEWRYDLNPDTNPYCMERIGVNATMNAGAINGMVNIYCWFVLRAGIESLFLLLLKVPMEWIISDFGIYQ